MVTGLAVAEQRASVLASLRRLDGTATVGDVVADSGLPADTVRAGLKSLLESHRGHLSVTDSGEIVYAFDPGMIERGSEPLLARFVAKARQVTSMAFKGWIVVMLVVYFVVFVALVIAALLASQRGNDSRGGWGGGRGRGGSFGFDPIFWYWIWGPRWRIGRPYYGHRWEKTLPEDDRIPFYKKVFAFVFGPDRPRPTQKQLDRSKLRLIRSRSGVVTTAELVEHTGETFPEAEDEMGRLIGAYDGEAAVSPDGELVYAFPGVMSSVRSAGTTRSPNPAWQRLEPELELTGNSTGANAVVIGMNSFTLLASASAPWFIFPRLGIAGPAAFWALVVVPVVFSVLFFTGPLVRMVGVKLENRRRRRRNLRRVLTGYVYDRALRGESVSERDAHAFVASRLEDGIPPGSVTALLDELLRSLDGEVSIDDQGAAHYRFDAIRAQYAASDSVRRRLRLDERSLGEVVFDTSDTAEDASARDLALFDRELVGGTPDLSGYLPALDRIDVEEPYELVAFDEELKRGR